MDKDSNIVDQSESSYWCLLVGISTTYFFCHMMNLWKMEIISQVYHCVALFLPQTHVICNLEHSHRFHCMFTANPNENSCGLHTLI